MGTAPAMSFGSQHSKRQCQSWGTGIDGPMYKENGVYALRMNQQEVNIRTHHKTTIYITRHDVKLVRPNAIMSTMCPDDAGDFGFDLFGKQWN